VAAAVHWVRNANPPVSATAALVLVDLMEDVTAESGEAHTKVDTIVGRLGISRRGVQRALKDLAGHPEAPLRRTFRYQHLAAVTAVTPVLLAYRLRGAKADTSDSARLEGRDGETCQNEQAEVPKPAGRGDTGGAPLKEDPLSVSPVYIPCLVPAAGPAKAGRPGDQPDEPHGNGNGNGHGASKETSTVPTMALGPWLRANGGERAVIAHFNEAVTRVPNIPAYIREMCAPPELVSWLARRGVQWSTTA
jgi:hypothetical protein